MTARSHRVAVDLRLDVDDLLGVGLEPGGVDLCEVGRTTTAAASTAGGRARWSMQKSQDELKGVGGKAERERRDGEAGRGTELAADAAAALAAARR